jgi:hypothetical protein
MASVISNSTKLLKAKITGTAVDIPDIQQLITEINIIESLDFPCIRMSIAVNDSINLIKHLRGSETIQISIQSEGSNESKKRQDFVMTIYRIGPRVRFEKKESYILECASKELQINEVTNVFGSFKNKLASDVINTLLTDKKYLNVDSTKRKLDIEKTRDKIQCVIPNWRPFEVINWLGSKSVREEKSHQGGFIFWETLYGYHFKSFDKIIIDAKNASNVPKYSYFMKKLTESSTPDDAFNIESITYPNLFDSIIPLRNGNWAGVMSGVALDFTSNSKFPNPGAKSAPYQGVEFNIISLYSKMEHLGNEMPYQMNNDISKYLYKKPRRNRYRANPLHLWDSKKAADAPSNQGEYQIRWEETAVYNYCRKLNFEAVKLDIKVPGNMNLHAGDPIDIEIPETIPDGEIIKPDKIYSGRYIIAGVRHKYSGGGSAMTTELTVVKDSLGNIAPK